LSADLALTNGKVLTMNPAQPVAEAVAIRGARIIKVGTNQEIRQLIGKETKILRLKGKTVLPGFIDTHIHVLDFGKLSSWLDLAKVRSIDELQDNVRRRVEKSARGDWILGRGWNEMRFTEKRLPNRLDLDEFSPENPVVLYHEIKQVCLVNSRTLELAGINLKTPILSDCSIERDAETCEPTGILRNSATDLVWHKIPEPSEKELLEATAHACEKIVEAGVTSVHWLVLCVAELSIAQKLHFQKRLPFRVNLIVPIDFIDDLYGFNSGDKSVLRVGGAVIVTDGYLASKTAALDNPYSDGLNSSGHLLTTPEELYKMIEKVTKAGLQLIIHAVGDKAVGMALTAVERAQNLVTIMNTPVRIEQAAVLNEKLIEQMKRHKVIVSVQPLVISSEFSMWHALEHLGTQRARWLFPLKTMLRNSIRVIAGSDCPMEPLNPLLGIQAAVTRKDFPEEQVKVEEILRMYTIDAAYSSGEETLKGSIEEGKLADLTVVSQDPTTVPPIALSKIDVELTIINGQIEYSKFS